MIRPQSTYRGARRNSWRDHGGAWAPNWIVPVHRANSTRDIFAGLTRRPGKYPSPVLLNEWKYAKKAMADRLAALARALRGGALIAR